MAETNTPSVKKYYDYAQEQIDEQAILDKYNAATLAQFNAQREQNRLNENKFYNQMYNTQRTALDTIRQANAAAVSTGASRGVQAAQELSSLLGLQQESVASATELAQANRQTAQEETAAVLENVLNAYKQAQQERTQLTQQAIESASVDVQQEANTTANKQVQTDNARLFAEAAENGTETYLTALQNAGIDYSNGVATPASQNSLNIALNSIGESKEGDPLKFSKNDWAGENTGAEKAHQISQTLNNILNYYGLDPELYKQDLADFEWFASRSVNWFTTVETNTAGYNRIEAILKKYNLPEMNTFLRAKKGYAESTNALYSAIKNKIYTDYAAGSNRKKVE